MLHRTRELIYHLESAVMRNLSGSCFKQPFLSIKKKAQNVYCFEINVLVIFLLEK